MKKITIIFLLLIVVIASLNAMGLISINLISKNYNTSATSPADVADPGTPVSRENYNANLKAGDLFLKASGLKMEKEYFISREALINLINAPNAKGIWIAPYPDYYKDSPNAHINLQVRIATIDADKTSTTDYGYVIKTFCPNTCEPAR